MELLYTLRDQDNDLIYIYSGVPIKLEKGDFFKRSGILDTIIFDTIEAAMAGAKRATRLNQKRLNWLSEYRKKTPSKKGDEEAYREAFAPRIVTIIIEE